jgi:hypothetical protein
MPLQQYILYVGVILILFITSCTNELEGHRERIFDCDGIVVNIGYSEDSSTSCGQSTNEGFYKILGDVGNINCTGEDTYLIQTLYFYNSEDDKLYEITHILEYDEYYLVGRKVLSDLCIDFDKASYVVLTLYLTSQPLLRDPDITLSNIKINRPSKI